MKKYHKEYEIDTNEIDGKQNKVFRYTGDYYMLSMDSKDKYKIFINNVCFCFFYIVLFLAAGLVNNSGSRNFFIAVPYAFLFLPIAYLIIGTFSLRNISEKMERVTYDKSFGRMKRSCMGIIFLSLYLCIADLFLIIINKSYINNMQEIVFLCINIVLFSCAIIHKNYLHKLQKRVIICKHDDGVPIDK